ncbi:MAG: hypothetical protein HRU19_19555 [Pseudobacteriovorax sp.]|nr:hypothetical protein [Pseudobacteriovorax sp.]
MAAGRAKNIIVIDNDPHIAEMISLYCPHDNVSSLVHVDNDLVSLGSPDDVIDLVVVDWAFRGDLCGPAIVNRIKSDADLARVPVLILYGSADHDPGLVREFFTLQAIPKPMSGTEFKKVVRSLFKEHKWCEKNADILTRIVNSSRRSAQNLPEKLIKLVTDSPNPGPIGKLVAKTLFSKGHHQAAEQVLLHILQKDQRNISALNTLGKIYCKTQRQSAAYALLRKADLLSPRNIERLCLLGKLELGRNDCAAAQESFLRAHRLDPHDHRVKLGRQASSKLKIQTNAGGISFSGAYASLLNTAAVAQVHRGKLADAMVYYHMALDHLECPILKAKVMFNVGLCYMRKNDIEKATQWFQSSQESGAAQFTRATRFMDRILNNHHLDSEIIDID